MSDDEPKVKWIAAPYTFKFADLAWAEAQGRDMLAERMSVYEDAMRKMQRREDDQFWMGTKDPRAPDTLPGLFSPTFIMTEPDLCRISVPMEMRFTPPKQPELMRWITHSRLGGMIRPPGPAFRIVTDVDELARDVSAFLDDVAKIGVLDEFKTLLADVGRVLDDEKARRRRMKRARRKRIRARGWT